MLGKINGKLKFMFRKQRCLYNSLRRLLLNALIQLHFDYACTSWFPMLNKRPAKKNAISAKQMDSLLFESKKHNTCRGY